jgi:hypothetical protein
MPSSVCLLAKHRNVFIVVNFGSVPISIHFRNNLNSLILFFFLGLCVKNPFGINQVSGSTSGNTRSRQVNVRVISGHVLVKSLFIKFAVHSFSFFSLLVQKIIIILIKRIQ